MKMLKHSTKEKYIFIDDKTEYIEIYSFEKYKNKFKINLYDTDYKGDKKKYAKKLEKLTAKGFEAYQIPAEVIARKKDFIAQIEYEKEYYFLEKNKNSTVKSNLLLFTVAKTINDKYRLSHISTEYDDDNYNNLLPTLENYIQGYIPNETNELISKFIVEAIDFYLTMYFVLGYKLQTIEQLTTLCISKEVTENTIFESVIYQYNEGNYIDVAVNNDLQCIKTTVYVVEDNKIIKLKPSYLIPENEAQLEDIVKIYAEDDKFALINKEDLLSLEIAKPEKYKAPRKQIIDLPKFPLEVPQEVLEIDKFSTAIIEEKKFYFFANTTAKNLLEWTIAFVSLADSKDDWYVYSKPFLLKDFNKNMLHPKDIELSYSDDRRAFAKKLKKAHKKAGLKSIEAKKIYKILTGKDSQTLNNQVKIKTFAKSTSDNTYIFDVYKNYACVRTINYFSWQFFNTERDLELWLLKNDTNINTLHKDEITSILQNTNHYLDENNLGIIAIRKEYLNNPLLKRIFSDGYDINKFNKSKIIFQEGKYIKGDYVFTTKNERYSENKTIIIEGSLIIDGTVFFEENSDNYIIIKGDLKAKNLIVNWNCKLIYVEGKVEIENITKSYFRFIAKNAKTKILLHEHKEALDIESSFNYKYEVSFYSKAITNREVLKKNSYNSLEWNEEKIYELLTKKEAFLTKKIKNTKTDLDEYYKDKFKRRMLDWGYFYPEYTGCETLGIGEDNEIKGNCIYPGSGDWVVNDLRGKSGTYGVSHEDYSICKLKVKHPEEFGIDYKQKPLKLKVNVEELMNRYISISMLYMNWAHRKTVSFSGEDKSGRDKKYENEKKAFIEDPHLALYWLNHFGATLDKRYDEVVSIIEKNKLTEKLAILKEPLAFFKKTDAYYNMEIPGGYSSNKKDFKDLFLKRRAYLIHWEHAYKNYKPDNLELWWKSITIYPKVEPELIVRIRWLKNNLEKCKNWKDFEKSVTNEDKNIPLLSYVLACNPNTSAKNKTKYADILINELLEHKNHWKTPHKKQFGEILLWDIRDFVSKKEKLQEATKFYFQGNETSKEFQDIQAVLGIKNKNIDVIRATIEKLEKVFEGYDRFDTPVKEKLKYHQKIEEALANLEPKILLETASNINNHELAKRYFVYLWNAYIKGKKEALIRLFVYIEFSGHDIDEILFGDKFPHLIKDKNDPNIEIVKAFINIPKADFRNDYMWENSKQAAVKFFLAVAHYPKIFDFLITTVKQKPNEENKHIVNAIYTDLFSEEYDSKINPTLRFSKSQIEIMLNTICNWFLTYGYQAEAYRSIYYCANPLAEEWIQAKMKDQKWLKRFAKVNTFYDPLDEELMDAFKSALEFIEDEKHNTYLEFKDEKSSKFWQIDYYNKYTTITYGKIGTIGRKIEKEYKSKKEAYKKGEKLVNTKLKKGYVRVEKFS